MLFNTVVFSAIAAFAALASAQTADSCAAGAIIGIQAVCGTDPKDCGSGRCCLSDQTCVPSGSTFACADPNLVPGTTQTVRAGCYATAGSTPTSSTSSGKPISSTGSGSGSTKPTSATGYSSDSVSGTVSSTTMETKASSSKGPSETGPSSSEGETGGASETKTGSYSSKGVPTGTGGGSYVTVTSSEASSSATWGNKGPSYSSASAAVSSAVAAPYTFTNGTVNYPTGSPSGSSSAPKSSSAQVVQSNSASSAFMSPQNSFAMLVSAVAVAAYWL
ncbi:hypothetical protein FKW77_003607 [Venturia effusa]|uniref:Extracellular membrane protein CFEM domain-containing protein n=1 Tax=Venturia effusa TaxID=50376 RepID=A0A517LQ36_9PEZI|nr:hypothetical protein FKW77_003607 [Venturia effusa]